MTEDEKHQQMLLNVEIARLRLNATPWWRPFKRQEAAAEYRNALLLGAIWEIHHPEGRMKP